jgi:hypothetical protein
MVLTAIVRCLEKSNLVASCFVLAIRYVFWAFLERAQTAVHIAANAGHLDVLARLAEPQQGELAFAADIRKHE